MDARVKLLLEMMGQGVPMAGVDESDTYSSAAWKGWDNALRIVREWADMTSPKSHALASAMDPIEKSSCV